MFKTKIIIDGLSVPVIVLDTVIVGSGCAGFNAADWLHNFGHRDIAIITEGINMGTSRNTGSDKQTYYKLSIASNGADSVAAMAADLFAGGGVNGDTALAEAAGSVRSFIKLCNLGVPFPTNEYGEYVGYKTDHDPRQRATSAGPLTSRMMTESLERSVRGKGIPILDGLTAVKLLVSDNKVGGLLCLDNASLDTPSLGITVIRAEQIILATGGPSGCYERSVYPESQTGMSGMAFEAGADGANLQEWQYGLASLKFRWNVSGTYQQVLPRYISIDENGVEREFLSEYYKDPYSALDMVFLKGYQWPFDTKKISGSSLIDILVHHETTTLKRRVYMDFRRNPIGLEYGFDRLSEETYRYLDNSGALFGTPIQRLEKMNSPAVDLYRQNGIDLYNEPLEIGVCVQHHNGGIAVDVNWQSSIKGLYAVGEAAGTFGITRPGGSALNSAQVGSLRAAEHIACTAVSAESKCSEPFFAFASHEAEKLLRQMKKTLGSDSNVAEHRKTMNSIMTRCAGHLRNIDGMAALEIKLREILESFFEISTVSDVSELPFLMKNRDIFITQLAVLSAMRQTALVGSRGSALITSSDGIFVFDGLDLKYLPNIQQQKNMRMITRKTTDKFDFVSAFEEARPLPKPEQWFETVWSDYRNRTAKLRGGN